MRLTLVALVTCVLFVACRSESEATAESPAVTDAGAPPLTLIDGGFEASALASSPIEGWYSDDLSAGRIRTSADTEHRVEGQRSLCVEQVTSRAPGNGRAFVSQAIRVPGSAARAEKARFSIALRSDEARSVLVELCVWDGHLATNVGRREFAVGTDWTHASLDCEIPAGHDRLGVWVYLPAGDGLRLWLDDAHIESPAG